MPKLKRMSDGEGFSGSITYAIKYREDKSYQKVGNGEPIIGCYFFAGTTTASTYSRDYWITSKVTEIIDMKKNEEGKLEYVKFRTENSIYECFA